MPNPGAGQEDALVEDGTEGGEASQEKKQKVRTRQRASLSCRECRRRKQKCNQAKDRPCNNCARRYPPVECIYDPSPSGSGGKRNDSRERSATKGTSQASGEGQKHRTDGLNLPSRLKPPGPTDARRSATPGLIPRTSSPIAEIDDETITSISVPDRALRELSPATRERLQTHSGSSPDISAIFLVDRPRPESHYFNQFNALSYGIDLVPRPIGASAEDVVGYLPIDATRRNAELLHFFVQRLSSFTSSIDGHNPLPGFTSQWITFMIQSPLVVYLSILSAAYFRPQPKRIDVEKSVEAMAIRTRLIGLINEHITGAAGGGVSDEAVAAVMSLSYNELIYSDRKSVIAHMSGLRSMIKTRGGLESIRTPVLRLLLARTDYQIALTFECEPFLHISRTVPIQPLTTYPKNIDCPFLLSPHRFVSSTRSLGIEEEPAQILDEMRFLTTSIHSLFHQTPSSQYNASTTKFLKTAKWLFSRLSDSPRRSAQRPSIKQSTAQHSSSPHRNNDPGTALRFLHPRVTSEALGKHVARPAPRWKAIPGVFLWVLLVVNPGVRDRPEGRFVKSMIAAGFVGVGVEDREVVEGIVRGAGLVQWWLERERWLGGTGPKFAEGNDPEERGKWVGSDKEVEDVNREPERVLNR